MIWVILIIANIPIYLFLGWIVVDTKAYAAASFWETLVALVQIILIPRVVRLMFDMDDEGAYGAVPIGIFLIACIGITAGEYCLIDTHLLN